MVSGGEHVFAFARRDGFFGQAHFVRCPCFDFDEDRDITLFSDNINFTVGSSGVPRHDFISTLCEIFGGCIFAPFADALIMTSFQKFFQNGHETLVEFRFERFGVLCETRIMPEHELGGPFDGKLLRSFTGCCTKFLL